MKLKYLSPTVNAIEATVMIVDECKDVKSKKNNLPVVDSVRNSVVIDTVDLGITRSESRAEGYAAFVIKDGPDKNSVYAKNDYLTGDGSYLTMHWRDFSYRTGLELKLPKGFRGKNLQVELTLKRYNCRCGEPLKPTRIYCSTAQKIHLCAEPTIVQDDSWTVISILLDRVIPQPIEDVPLALFIDDTENFHLIDQHYGLSLSLVRLLCDEIVSEWNMRQRYDLVEPSNLDCEVVIAICPVWDTLWPPISVAVNASYLRMMGVQTKILDFNIDAWHKVPENLKGIWHGHTCKRWDEPEFVENVLHEFAGMVDEVARQIAASPAKLVAFSIYSTSFVLTNAVAQKVKFFNPNKIVVYGGPGIISRPDRIGHSWDFLIIGDGEKTLYDVFSDNWMETKGIIHRSRFKGIDQRRPEVFSYPVLDELPLLSYEGFNLNRYHFYDQLPAYTSRGCIRRCSYCFDSYYYAPYRRLSGPRAYEHFVHLFEAHGRKYYELSDLLLNGDLASVTTMAEMLKRDDLGIKWGGFAAIRKEADQNFYDALRAGGCDYVRYGFETACDKHLQQMHRGYVSKEAEQVIVRTKNAGIKVCINILVGFPEETDDTIKETLDFLKKNKDFIDVVETVNTITLMPTTDLFTNQEKYGINMCPEGWVTDKHTIKQRQAWANMLLREIEQIGITHRFGMHEGGERFTIEFTDAIMPVAK